jgi:hypothetical protein
VILLTSASWVGLHAWATGTQLHWYFWDRFSLYARGHLDCDPPFVLPCTAGMHRPLIPAIGWDGALPHFFQAGLKLPSSPISASQVARIAALSHHMWHQFICWDCVLLTFCPAGLEPWSPNLACNAAPGCFFFFFSFLNIENPNYF